MVRRVSRNFTALVSTLGLAALVAGCQTSEPAAVAAAPAQPAPSTATVMVANQTATNSIAVGSVTMASNGFVTIHGTDDTGAMIAPDSIGHVAVQAGTSSNVVVPLDQPVGPGDVVHVMLHEDTGQPGVYEFKTGSTDVDLPIMVGGAPVMTAITIQ